MQKMQHDNSVSESHVIFTMPFPLVSGRFYKRCFLAGMSLEDNVLDRTIAVFTLSIYTFDNAIQL